MKLILFWLIDNILCNLCLCLNDLFLAYLLIWTQLDGNLRSQDLPYAPKLPSLHVPVIIVLCHSIRVFLVPTQQMKPHPHEADSFTLYTLSAISHLIAVIDLSSFNGNTLPVMLVKNILVFEIDTFVCIWRTSILIRLLLCRFKGTISIWSINWQDILDPITLGSQRCITPYT